MLDEIRGDSVLIISDPFLYQNGTAERVGNALAGKTVAYFSESHRGIMEKLAGNNVDELFRRVEWSYKYWYMTFQEEDSSKSGDAQKT